MQVRREKLERLRALGIDPFPARAKRTHTASHAIDAFERWESAGGTGEPSSRDARGGRGAVPLDLVSG